MAKIMVGAENYMSLGWFGAGIFYPPTIQTGADYVEALQHYAKQFNLMELDFQLGTRRQILRAKLDALDDFPNFRFAVVNDIEILDDIDWELYSGVCDFLQNQNRLAYFYFRLSPKIRFNTRTFAHFRELGNMLPKSVRFAFEFGDNSWTEDFRVISFFKKQKSWSIAVPCVENAMIHPGWAGNIPSTRVACEKSGPKLTITTDFICYRFYGTYGQHYGSYDDEGFLERLTQRFRNLTNNGIDVFCVFNNFSGTVNYPLPVSHVFGVPLCPKLKSVDQNKPCSLHDALKLQKLLNSVTYSTDADGFVKLKWVE